MRKVHGRICREQEINLFLDLQHLSEEPDCKDEWMFVESRPLETDEHNICPCGQIDIKAYFFSGKQNQWKSYLCGIYLH